MFILLILQPKKKKKKKKKNLERTDIRYIKSRQGPFMTWPIITSDNCSYFSIFFLLHPILALEKIVYSIRFYGVYIK